MTRKPYIACGITTTPKNVVVVSAAVTGVVPISAAFAKFPPGALVVSTSTTVEFGTWGFGVEELLGVTAGVPLTLGVALAVPLLVAVPVAEEPPELVSVPVGVIEGVIERETLRVADGVALLEDVPDDVAVLVNVCDGVSEAEAPADGVCVPDGVGLALGSTTP